MSRMSPGKLAQKYPPLPQLPRQSRQQGSRTQVENLMKFTPYYFLFSCWRWRQWSTSIYPQLVHVITTKTFRFRLLQASRFQIYRKLSSCWTSRPTCRVSCRTRNNRTFNLPHLTTRLHITLYETVLVRFNRGVLVINLLLMARKLLQDVWQIL